MEKLNQFLDAIGPIRSQHPPEEDRRIYEAREHVLTETDHREVRLDTAIPEVNEARPLLRNTTGELDQKYRTLFEHSGTAMAVIENDGIISHANSLFMKKSGYTREEVENKAHFADFIDEGSQKMLLDYHLRRRGGDPTVPDSYETRVITKEGKVLEILVMMSMFPGTGQSIFSMIDITDRKKTENAIKEQERFLNDVLSSFNDRILVMDPSMKILRVNKTMEQWYSQSMPLVGKPCYEALYQRNQPCESCPVQDTLRTGKPHREIHTVKDRDMTVGWKEVHSYPMFSPETGGITAVIGHIRDITEQKNLEYTYEQEMDYYTAELKRFAETLGMTNNKLNILNNVTRHDILNTVTGLLGSVDMALAAGTHEEQTALLHDIRNLGKTVQSQIEFTRQYQNIGVQAADWFNVQSLIASTAEQLPLAGISLEIHVEGIAIHADPLIGKVFYNLMENSLRHGGHVTKISFDVRRTDSGIVITYSDDGAGIPEEIKEMIFLQGFGKHTGFGMYLVREILSITGITIKETGETGKGARFEMTVPEAACRETGTE
jgi:PAS domain S-box-containing protein